MNIAFSALVIAILALPGVLFSRFSHPDRRFLQSRGLAEDLIQGILVSLVLHIFWAFAFSWLGSFWGLTVSIKNAMKLAAGPIGNGAADFESAIESVSLHPGPVVIYFVSLYAAAIGFGLVMKNLLQSDPKSRFSLLLHYLLDHGQALRSQYEWEDDLGSQLVITGRLFSAIVCLDKTPYLFVGLLDHGAVKYNLEGVPDRFVLTGPMRKKLGVEEEPFQVIQSAKFILRYSEITTMGVWSAGAILPTTTLPPSPPNNPAPQTGHARAPSTAEVPTAGTAESNRD